MKRLFCIAGAALTLGLAGCGGGGTSATSTAGRAAVPVFVTDSPETDNDHVWVTIFKIEVLDGAGQSQTVFEDPTGKAIDVKTLRDASGQRFAFLSDGTVTSGTHTGARVTLGSSLTLFPHGSTVGQSVPLDDSIVRDSQGNAVISFPLAPRNLAAGNDEVVIDFDLAHFILKNGKIAPALQEGGHEGLTDSKRHEPEDHTGKVTSLAGTAPSFTFTLQVGNAGSVMVVTNANTVLFNADSSPNPALANGQTVEITGLFDPATKTVTAKSIKIEDRAQHAVEVEVQGMTSAPNAATGTFTLSTQTVHGFMPTQGTVNVVTTSATVLRSSGGVVLLPADFFAALAATQRANIGGTYNAATNTVTATRARLIAADANDGPHDGEAQGTPTTIDAAARTFTIQPVTEFDGFALSGTSINIATSATTRYRIGDATVSATDFFAALATAKAVQVEGSFLAGTMTASSAHIPTGAK